MIRPRDEQCVRFIHFDGFTADWKHLGLDDEDLRVLQNQIMLLPHRGTVIPATGGLRKTRFSPPSSRRGKRGGLRVLYAYFPKYAVCVLAAAYAKTEAEDIELGEKKALKRLLEEIAEVLEHGG